MFSRTDTVGNLCRHTDRRLHDQAQQMHHQSDNYQREHGQYQLKVVQHSIEEVGGFKRIETLRAIELLVGDDLTLGSLGNLSQTAAGDLVEVVGQLRRAVAGELQHLEAPRSWMGTDSTNTFRLLLQLMNMVEQLAAATASHTHGGGPVPGNSQAIAGQGQQATSLADQLLPIIE